MAHLEDLTHGIALKEILAGRLVTATELPYPVPGDTLSPWSFAGYGQPIARATTAVQVWTPRLTVQALVHCYQPTIHPSAASPA